MLRPLAEAGQEATGSMGDDTPMAVLSQQRAPPYDYFRQQFAQVTNPPIDPLREAVVMSLETCIGPEQQPVRGNAEHARAPGSPARRCCRTRNSRPCTSLTEAEYRLASRCDLNYDPAHTNLRRRA